MSLMSPASLFVPANIASVMGLESIAQLDIAAALDAPQSPCAPLENPGLCASSKIHVYLPQDFNMRLFGPSALDRARADRLNFRALAESARTSEANIGGEPIEDLENGAILAPPTESELDYFITRLAATIAPPVVMPPGSAERILDKLEAGGIPAEVIAGLRKSDLSEESTTDAAGAAEADFDDFPPEVDEALREAVYRMRPEVEERMLDQMQERGVPAKVIDDLRQKMRARRNKS